MFVRALLFSTILFFGHHVFAVETVNLRSEQGARIRLEYEKVEVSSNSNKPVRHLYADLIKILVSGPGVAVDSQGQAVLISVRNVKNACGGENYVEAPGYVVDLYYSEEDGALVGYFDGHMPIWANAECYSLSTTQELALVIDGEWHVDPVNGTHNFQFGY